MKDQEPEPKYYVVDPFRINMRDILDSDFKGTIIRKRRGDWGNNKEPSIFAVRELSELTDGIKQTLYEKDLEAAFKIERERLAE